MIKKLALILLLVLHLSSTIEDYLDAVELTDDMKTILSTNTHKFVNINEFKRIQKFVEFLITQLELIDDGEDYEKHFVIDGAGRLRFEEGTEPFVEFVRPQNETDLNKLMRLKTILSRKSFRHRIRPLMPEFNNYRKIIGTNLYIQRIRTLVSNIKPLWPELDPKYASIGYCCSGSKCPFKDPPIPIEHRVSKLILLKMIGDENYFKDDYFKDLNFVNLINRLLSNIWLFF